MRELKLLGMPAVLIDGSAAGGRIAQRRQLALLTLLGAHHRAGVTRDRIVGLLWPDQPPDRARRLLSDSLYLIRRALGDVVISAGDSIRLDTASLPVDVAAVDQALDAGTLEAAVAAYSGPFLDGFYAEESPDFDLWSESERARVAARVAHAARELARIAESAGDLSAAAQWLARCASIDPLDASVACDWIAVLERAGNTVQALRVAQAFATRHRRELDIDPPAAILTALDRLGATRPQSDARAQRSRATVARNPEAHAAYLRGLRLGWAAWSRGTHLDPAIAAFDHAIALDPGYAPAHGGLATAYLNLAANPQRDTTDAYARARRHATRALELDAELAQAHAVIGHVCLYADWDWSGARESYTRALDINPHLAETWVAVAWWNAFRGRGAEAIEASERGWELDPLSPMAATFHAYTLYWAREMDAAVAHCDHLLTMDSNAAFGFLLRGLASLSLGRVADAVRDIERGHGLLPQHPLFSAFLAAALGQHGDAARAAAISASLESALGQAPPSQELAGLIHVSLAIISAALGDRDRAVAELRRALALRAGLLLALDAYPVFDSLRGRGDYDDVRRAVGLLA